MDEKLNLNSNEKLARAVTGIETDAKHFTMNGKSAEELFEMEARDKFNQGVDAYANKFDTYTAKLEEYAQKFNENLNGMEIKAIGNYAIISTFTENPFQRIKKSDSGIILDTGGYAPIVKSNETGEYIEEEQFIHVGSIVDAGPECKWVKDGDVVMWTKPSEVPIPFYRQPFVLVNENRFLCVINEGLTKRFEENGK